MSVEIIACHLLPGDRFQFDGREWLGDRIAVTTGEPTKVRARPFRDGAAAGPAIELTIGAEQLLRLYASAPSTGARSPSAPKRLV